MILMLITKKNFNAVKFDIVDEQKGIIIDKKTNIYMFMKLNNY
jgi:hypothetical protein